MKDEVQNAHGKTLNGSNIEFADIKLFPDKLRPGETVVITEKLHSAWRCLGRFDNEPIVTSKGNSRLGVSFIDNEANRDNIYLRQWHRHREAILSLLPEADAVYVLGEAHGKDVQDMEYGLSGVDFRVFDIYAGKPPTGRLLNWDELTAVLPESLPAVPVLYRGPYSREKLAELTAGKSALADHRREGVVVKTVPETGRPRSRPDDLQEHLGKPPAPQGRHRIQLTRRENAAIPSIIQDFVTAVDQAISATALESAEGRPYDREADACRAAAVHRACDTLLAQAKVTLEHTGHYPSGAAARHQVSITARDGGQAYAMIHWGEDHLDFWPEGKPRNNWHEGRIVWHPWGEAGMALFDRLEQAIGPGAGVNL